MQSEDNSGVKMMLRVASVLAIFLAWSYFAVGQTTTETVNTTICKISHRPAPFEGKLVRIKAVYAGSFEGSYLLDPACGKSVWFTTPDESANIAAVLGDSAYPKVPEATFDLVRDKEYEKFTNLAYAAVENFQPEYEVTATFTGRIDRCNDFKVNKKGFGNGFGQMGLSEFQFVLHSLADVNAKKAEGLVEPTRSALPSYIPEK
jgi:hypothetical protein